MRWIALLLIALLQSACMPTSNPHSIEYQQVLSPPAPRPAFFLTEDASIDVTNTRITKAEDCPSF